MQEQGGVHAPVQMLSLGRPGSLTCSFWVVVFKFQAAKLKKEQEHLLKQQWELESLEEERKQMEEHRKKKELGYEVERLSAGLGQSPALCPWQELGRCFRWQHWVVNIWVFDGKA